MRSWGSKPDTGAQTAAVSSQGTSYFLFSHLLLSFWKEKGLSNVINGALCNHLSPLTQFSPRRGKNKNGRTETANRHYNWNPVNRQRGNQTKPRRFTKVELGNGTEVLKRLEWLRLTSKVVTQATNSRTQLDQRLREGQQGKENYTR